MSVWIAQCLCPARHCILAAVGEADSVAEAQRTIRTPLRKQIDDLLAGGAINAWCGICRAPVGAWSYEVALTKFSTLDEAAGPLAKNEAAQIVTSMAIGEMAGPRKPDA